MASPTMLAVEKALKEARDALQAQDGELFRCERVVSVYTVLLDVILSHMSVLRPAIGKKQYATALQIYIDYGNPLRKELEDLADSAIPRLDERVVDIARDYFRLVYLSRYPAKDWDVLIMIETGDLIRGFTTRLAESDALRSGAFWSLSPLQQGAVSRAAFRIALEKDAFAMQEPKRRPPPPPPQPQLQLQSQSQSRQSHAVAQQSNYRHSSSSRHAAHRSSSGLAHAHAAIASGGTPGIPTDAQWHTGGIPPTEKTAPIVLEIPPADPVPVAVVAPVLVKQLPIPIPIPIAVSLPQTQTKDNGYVESNVEKEDDDKDDDKDDDNHSTASSRGQLDFLPEPRDNESASQVYVSSYAIQPPRRQIMETLVRQIQGVKNTEHDASKAVGTKDQAESKQKSEASIAIVPVPVPRSVSPVAAATATATATDAEYGNDAKDHDEEKARDVHNGQAGSSIPAPARMLVLVPEPEPVPEPELEPASDSDSAPLTFAIPQTQPEVIAIPTLVMRRANASAKHATHPASPDAQKSAANALSTLEADAVAGGGGREREDASVLLSVLSQQDDMLPRQDHMAAQHSAPPLSTLPEDESDDGAQLEEAAAAGEEQKREFVSNETDDAVKVEVAAAAEATAAEASSPASPYGNIAKPTNTASNASANANANANASANSRGDAGSHVSAASSVRRRKLASASILSRSKAAEVSDQ